MSAKALQSLDLAIAQKQISDLSGSLARICDENEACQGCQEPMQEAIEAFRWITRAEETIRQGVYCGLIEFTPQLDETIQSLYRDLFASCEETKKLVARHRDCSSEPLDAGEFFEVSSLVREKLNSLAWVRKSRKFRNEPAHEAAES